MVERPRHVDEREPFYSAANEASANGVQARFKLAVTRLPVSATGLRPPVGGKGAPEPEGCDCCARVHAEWERQGQLATEQSQRLAAILEQLPSAVFVLDARGVTVLTNVAGRRISGLPKESQLPLPEQVDYYRTRDPLTGRRLEPHETPSARVLAGQVVERAEVLIWHPKHRMDMWMRVDGTPLHDSNGQLSGAVLVYTDVTRERILARDLAATALEHARLLGKLAERKARLERLADQLAEPWLDPATTAPRPLPFDALSRRERETLRLLARGLTNREIGASLHLSPGTVRNQVGRLLRKLGVNDRTQAAVLALTRGLLDME